MLIAPYASQILLGEIPGYLYEKAIRNTLNGVLAGQSINGCVFLCRALWHRSASGRLGGHICSVCIYGCNSSFFMPSYVVLDYDNDTIEVKKWGVIRYDLTRCHGLSKAKAVKIVCDSSGDSGYTITKYLVFNDGEEIELPEWSKDIEHLLTRWYEQYFHVQLPVLEEGFTKGLLSKRRAQ